jgi:hypothetical protein
MKPIRGIRLLHPRWIGQLENDAQTQAKFHLAAIYFWLVQMFGVLAYVWYNMPHNSTTWLFLYLTEISLGALVATEFGALSAAQASSKADTVTITTTTTEVQF